MKYDDFFNIIKIEYVNSKNYNLKENYSKNSII